MGFLLTTATKGNNHQIAAEALVGLLSHAGEQGTADELIVESELGSLSLGLDSLSLDDDANYNSLSMEDSEAIDGNAVGGVEAGGVASLNDLRQMGRVLHRYDPPSGKGMMEMRVYRRRWPIRQNDLGSDACQGG